MQTIRSLNLCTLIQSSRHSFARSNNKGLPKPYDPMKSKYGMERRTQNTALLQERKDEAPAYLQDEERFKEYVNKDYELVNPEDLKEKAKIQRLKELEKEERKKRKSDPKALAVIQDQIAKQKQLSEFDRFDENFVQAYM